MLAAAGLIEALSKLRRHTLTVLTPPDHAMRASVPVCSHLARPKRLSAGSTPVSLLYLPTVTPSPSSRSSQSSHQPNIPYNWADLEAAFCYTTPDFNEHL